MSCTGMERLSNTWCCPSDCTTGSGHMFDIQEMSLKWAEDQLRNRLPLRENCIVKRWRTPYNMADIGLHCQWDDLQIKTVDMEVTGFNNMCSSDEGQEYVLLSKSHFSNNTEMEQTYNFGINKTTKFRVRLDIQQGMKMGENTRVKFLVPKEILNETTEFGKSITIVRADGHKIEGDQHWTGQHPIRVARGSSIMAEVHILNRRLDIQFSARTVVSGRVKILVTDPKANNKVVRELDNDIASIVKYNLERNMPCSEEEWGFTSVKSSPLAWFPDGCRWDLSKASVTFTVKGTSSFQYGYEQCVKVNDV